MYCRNCGNEVSDKAIMCVKCGTPPKSGNNYCDNCQAKTDPKAKICVKCGVELAKEEEVNNVEEKDWLTALLLCLFFGFLGVHRFYTKHTGIGIIQLLTFGGFFIWTFIDFIMILSGSYKDADGKTLVKK